MVNDRLTPTDHVSKLLKKVTTNTRLLLAVRHLMNSHLSLKFYHHFIHSYLTYGSDIYFSLATSKQATSLTILQKRLSNKYALSLPRRYPTRFLEHSSVLLLPKLACYFSAILGYTVLNNTYPQNLPSSHATHLNYLIATIILSYKSIHWPHSTTFLNHYAQQSL